MSVWFPILGHPIPKDVAILCCALLLAEQPLFFLRWHLQGHLPKLVRQPLTLSALVAHGRAGFVNGSWRCNAHAAGGGGTGLSPTVALDRFGNPCKTKLEQVALHNDFPLALLQHGTTRNGKGGGFLISKIANNGSNLWLQSGPRPLGCRLLRTSLRRARMSHSLPAAGGLFPLLVAQEGLRCGHTAGEAVLDQQLSSTPWQSVQGRQPFHSPRPMWP